MAMNVIIHREAEQDYSPLYFFTFYNFLGYQSLTCKNVGQKLVLAGGDTPSRAGSIT